MEPPLNPNELIHLGGDEPVAGPTDAELVAQIPEGMPVRLEYDVANNVYRYVALTLPELKQRADDTAAAEAQAAQAQIADDAKQALAEKLTAGKATDTEVQQALAELLG